MVRNEVEVVPAARQRLAPVGVWSFALSPASIDQERQAVHRIDELGYGSNTLIEAGLVLLREGRGALDAVDAADRRTRRAAPPRPAMPSPARRK